MKALLTTSDLVPNYKLDIQSPISYNANSLFLRPNITSKYKYIIDYEVKLSNGKSLQRDFVWNIEQKRSLILSMIKELQMPNFAVALERSNDMKTTIFRIIDGKQRLSTIEQFVNNEFCLVHNGQEYFYKDMDDMCQYRVHSYSLNFNIIYEYDDERLSDEQLISWFELVNFAGTAQDEKHLQYLKS